MKNNLTFFYILYFLLQATFIFLFCSCKSVKPIIIDNNSSILDSLTSNSNEVNSIDTFSLECWQRKIVINKNNPASSLAGNVGYPLTCLAEYAYYGDQNAVQAILKILNKNNLREISLYAKPYRGKRLFEHILYNIASEIYCGNPWADPYPDYVDEAISPGFMTLIDMIDTINGETYGFRDVLDFTVEESNALDSKYKHLYRKKDDTYLEICPGSLKVCNDYWQIRVAYERGLVVLKDFGER